MGPHGVPVTVVTGFLGAGKTTLVNRWLAELPRGEVAVIVNEHGATGIDGELLAERVRVLIEITGGCVCCKTQGELVRALDALSIGPPVPRRVLVETSGAASPAGVIGAIAASGSRTGAFALDGVITVVDATRLKLLVEHDLALEQLGYADVVILSRADMCSADEAANAAALVATYNGAAFSVPARKGSLARGTLEDLLEARRADFAEARAVPPSTHPTYDSVSLGIAGDVDGERFADFVESELAAFGGRIFRLKGILAVAGSEERMIVQGVADLVEVMFGASWGSTVRTSRLVVVGFGLDGDALARGFAGCAADAR